MGFFKGKKILLISPEEWSHLFVSKHHYAIELSRSNTVYFLNPPSKKTGCSNSGFTNLWIIDYRPFVKGLRYFPRILRLYFLRKKFLQVQELASAEFDCVWSFDNSVFFDYSFLPNHVLKICHIVDYSQNFQFFRAASTADICFGVSQNIVDRLLRSNKNSFLIPHGVTLRESKPLDVQLPGVNSVKALYAGNLNSKYLDSELVFELVNENPNVDFVFLGSGGQGLPRKSNVYFLGVIKHEYLSSYLEKADVLLLLYETEKFPDQLTNAHKILEYLGSGNVIVSTFISDYENKSTLLEMGRSRVEILSLFKEITADPSKYNCRERRQDRIKYAAENTYRVRLCEIERHIQMIPRKI